MPQSRSTFIKSKMNKDVDSRIMPNGEYRDAQNVSISKSEGSDVGALENVLGNQLLIDINSNLGSSIKNLEVIGYFMDIDNNRIFFMLTNYNDTSGDELSNFFRIVYDEETHKIHYFNKMSDYAISTYYLKKQYNKINNKDSILKIIKDNDIVISVIAVSFVIFATKIIMQWINI